MAHRIAPRAETDLGDIWLYVGRESGSIEIANRLIDTVTNRFFVLGNFPRIGRSVRKTLTLDTAACRSANMSSSIASKNDEALILRVVHGRRDLETLFGH